MYDVEKILGIDYTSKQELSEIDTNSKEEIIDDRVEEWITSTVLIKQGNEVFVTKTGNLTIGAIISYGPEIIDLLRCKLKYDLPKEDDTTQECIVIDINSKIIFIDQSEFGLWEQTAHLWGGYKLTMGDIGYIATLQLANINTDCLLLSQKEVVTYFNELVTQTANFNSTDFAQQIIQGQKDVVFHPDFFDSTKPKKTITEVVYSNLKAFFKKNQVFSKFFLTVSN